MQNQPSYNEATEQKNIRSDFESFESEARKDVQDIQRNGATYSHHSPPHLPRLADQEQRSGLQDLFQVAPCYN